jgi:hypothetical protein
MWRSYYPITTLMFAEPRWSINADMKYTCKESLVFCKYLSFSLSLLFQLQSAKVYIGIDNRGIVIRFPSRARDFRLLQIAENGSGTHPASFSMGTGGASPRLKRPVREAEHSTASSANIKNEWSYTSTLPYALLAYIEKTLL